MRKSLGRSDKNLQCHLPNAQRGGGRIEPLRRDSGGGGSRYELVNFGNVPPPGATLNAGSDLPQAKLGGGDLHSFLSQVVHVL